MSQTSLRLRVDPPYPGESMTSFLERAAQIYCQPLRSLLAQLVDKVEVKHGRRDLDRWPPVGLMSALEKAVPDWRSPQQDLVGFRSWLLSPTVRHAYCPTCFVEDLIAQRIPYFRQDWMAVLTTICWKHKTPLCQWQTVTCGVRRLPPVWLFKTNSTPETYPKFFQNDLDRLQALSDVIAGPKPERPDLMEAFGLLRRLQEIAEKPAADPMPATGGHTGIEAEFRCHLQRLSLLAVSYSWAEFESGPPAACLKLEKVSDWFGPHPDGLGPRQHEYRESSLRLGGEVSWRRSYLWLVARTLASCKPFASHFFPEFQPLEPWEDWWDRDVRPLCPPAFHDSFDFEGRFLKECSARY